MIRRLLLALCVALGAVTAVPAGAAEVPADVALFVPADGTTVATPFATFPGATYLVSVSGTFTYHATGALADCGSHDANQALTGDSWVVGGGVGLRVDGTAPCDRYDERHVYPLAAAGTGQPLRFSIADVTGHADNTGGLTVTVTTTWALDGTCEHVVTGAGVDTVIWVVAEGRHTHVPTFANVLQTEVACDLVVDGRPALHVEQRVPGRVAVAAGVKQYLLPFDVKTCVTVSVYDLSGSLVTRRSWPCS